MEAANLALAYYLVNLGTQVHIVTHQAHPELVKHPLIHTNLVPTPVNSFMLGEPLLANRGAAIATRLKCGSPELRVLVNGGCCAWPDVNWVHCVHAAWPTHNDERAPVWFKAKNRVMKIAARRRELHALRRARLIIANSKRTKDEIVNRIGVPESRIQTVYLGTDPKARYFGLRERLRGRTWLRKPDSKPIVAFVGAMGHDNNKGFDTLWKAWTRLCTRKDWDADLVVAGGGRAVASWKERVAQAGLRERVTLLGFTERVNELLAASDLLVSPVRYEAFGLNVQEALAGGIPALVSASAGVAELYPSSLKDLLLKDPEDVDELIRQLLSWRGNLSYWKQRVEPLSHELRSYTWEHMARHLIEFANTPLFDDLRGVAGCSLQQSPGRV